MYLLKKLKKHPLATALAIWFIFLLILLAATFN